MAIITKKEFLKLSETHDAFCASIYIPTHRAGFDEQKQDTIQLKTQAQEMNKKLVAKGMNQAEAERMMEPLNTLISDTEFWRHQSDGLALFLTPGSVTYFAVPLSFEANNHLGSNFYLKPLLPMFTGNGMFFVLALQADDTSLYQATKYSITDIRISDLIPQELEETVGYDYEQKTFQTRTQSGGSTVFHGHGAGKDDVKKELKEYFRDIDKGLMQILHDENLPMLLAGEHQILSIYKEVSNYPHLLEETLSTNPSSMDDRELHKKAWEIVQPLFEKDFKEKKNEYGQYFSEGKTIHDVEEILKAAMAGRIDTLFVQKDQDQYGIYDVNEAKLHVTGESSPSAVSLTNLASVIVMQHGGTVYLADKEELPMEDNMMNALCRF